MSRNPLALHFIRAALVFFGVGVGMGVFMSMSQDFTIRPVHVHVNLLGWVSFFLYGAFYMLFPTASAMRIARVHYWLAITGLPAMALGLTLVLYGFGGVGLPLLLAGEFVAVAGVLAFIYVGFVATSVRAERRAGALAPAE